MKRLRTYAIIKSIIFLSILSARIGAAQNITFEASVDKTQMSIEDVLVLSLVIAGGNLDFNVMPELPDSKGAFDIVQGPSRSTSISIINGKQSSALTLQYLLAPQKTGKLTIGAATLEANKQKYATKPITIQVLSGTPAQPQSPGTPPDADAQGNAAPDVYLRAEADKATAYIGEQVTLAYYLYTRVNIAGYDISEQPNFTGFWVEEMETPKPPTLQYQMLNGVRYGVALLKKVALFPASSGNLTIEPMLMRFSVKVNARARDPFGQVFEDPFDNFFGRTQELVRKTQPLELNVLPLPEAQRPDTFNGDVGNFTMAVSVGKTQVQQDEPVTLIVKIQGTGNIKTVKEPKITLPESFKRYDPEITETPFPLHEPLQGEKIFKSVIIPTAAGEFQLAPVEFAYFDPQRKTYQTLRSEPIRLVSLPAAQKETPLERRIATKEDIKLLGRDIRFIKTELPDLRGQGQFLYQAGWFRLSVVLPLLIMAAAALYQRYHAKYLQDERYVRRKRAKKLARQHFKTAAALAQRGEAKEFYAAISQTLRQYLGDKFNLRPAGITGAEISALLADHGLDAVAADLLQRCLAECDFARFAPVGSSTAEMDAMLRNAASIIEHIEKLKIQKAQLAVQGAKIMAGLLLLWTACGLLPVVCTAETLLEEYFRQGNKFYEDGNYREAIGEYQKIVQTGLKNGAVYYNLGNALLKEKQVGEAILAFERAKRLLPRDEDVAFNLDYARALTLDKMEQATSGAFERFLLAVRDFFSPNELSGGVLSLEIVLTGLLIASLFAAGRWKTRLRYGALLPAVFLLLSGSLLLAQISVRTAVAEAILLAPKVEARTGPGDGYSTVFEIHEGAKVRIQREKLDWVEIKLPNQVIGWVMQKDLTRIE